MVCRITSTAYIASEECALWGRLWRRQSSQFAKKLAVHLITIGLHTSWRCRGAIGRYQAAPGAPLATARVPRPPWTAPKTISGAGIGLTLIFVGKGRQSDNTHTHAGTCRGHCALGADGLYSHLSPSARRAVLSVVEGQAESSNPRPQEGICAGGARVDSGWCSYGGCAAGRGSLLTRRRSAATGGMTGCGGRECT